MKRPDLVRRSVMLGFLLVATGTTSLLAQDFEVEDAPVVAQNMFELHESNFDMWIFGNNAGSSKTQLDALLMLSIGEVDRSCTLTESQKKKLLLAGRGDIKHFMDRVAEARKVFEKFRRDQNNMQAIMEETQPLAAIFQAGLFGPDSFFTKTVRTTLEPDQAEKYQKVLVEKNQFRYRARVRMAIANLDRTLGLTAEQRQKLIELVLQETKPSQKSSGQYEQTVVLYKIAQIPEAKIRPIVDEARWQSLSKEIQEAKGMEEFLKTNGYLDEVKLQTTAKPAETKND